jgi:cytochrome c biogenesis protein CcdA
MDFMPFLEQMGTSDIAILAAFFIGLMTAISPCPLATNMTAIAYVSKRIDNSKNTLFVGLLYAFGRAFAYTVLASLIVYIGINTQGISFFLQEYGEKLLGPLLIVIGVISLDLIKIESLTCGGRLAPIQTIASENGYLGAFFLGVLFSLAFCPFSAVLYFGMLIPLALKTGDAILLPSVFGLATGLPVVLFSILLVNGVSKLSHAMGQVQKFEKGMRLAMGAVFLLVGIYYLVTRTLQIRF